MWNLVGRDMLYEIYSQSKSDILIFERDNALREVYVDEQSYSDTSFTIHLYSYFT